MVEVQAGFEVAPKQEGSSASISFSSASLISAFEGGPAFDLVAPEISSGSVGLASAAELVVVERVTGMSRMSISGATVPWLI